MTGFAAIFTGGPASHRDLDRMLSAMDYRVSDQEGRWVSDRGALGVRVLHTNAESLECDQPHASGDGNVTLAFDGYLANCEELSRDFDERGLVSRNRSDAELVLRAYELWGTDCTRHLQGEFALVIVDLRRHCVFCARDHAGLRPLYYALQDDRFIVATDIGAVVAAMGPRPEPNKDFLAELMAIRVYSGEGTAWRGVKRLRQAHWLEFDATAPPGSQLRSEKYWSVPNDITIRYKRDEEYVEHYLDLLTDCIRRASRTHKTLAMTVSGGLDSSALFCFADKLIAEGKIQAPDIRGYSLAAKPGSPAYELPYARAAAEHVGRPLEEVPLFQPDLDWYRYEAAERRDFPISTNTAMSTDLRVRAASHGSRAIMGGHGGDEWLQGAAVYYRQMAADLDFKRFFETLFTQAGEQGWRRVGPFAARQALLAMVPHSLLRPLQRRKRLSQRQRHDDLFWLTNEAKAHIGKAHEDYLASLPSDTLAFLKENLISQPLGDFGKSYTVTQYARAGLEGRSPMFARQFIEFSASTPEHIKYRGAKTKLTHRKAMEGVLPRKVLDRRMKAHFPSEGVESQFADFYDKFGVPLLDGLCDRAGVARLMELYRQCPIEEDEWGWEVWGVFGAAAFLLDNAE